MGVQRLPVQHTSGPSLFKRLMIVREDMKPLPKGFRGVTPGGEQLVTREATHALSSLNLNR